MISRHVIKQSAAIVRPPPRLTISEWADRDAWIPHEGNAEEGKFRLARMPHEAAMLDDPMQPGVGEVYWMLASQAGGKTMCLILICEFVICQLRKSMIVARATKETAQEWMRDKFLPTTEATPCMAGLLTEPRKRGSNSTSLNRKFPGGGLKVIGAKSPAAFRGSSAGILLADEIDSWTTIKEGDPLALLDRAATTFSDAWKIRCSTPTLEGFSRIAEGYERGDKQKYFLPCCHCGEFQWLKFSQLKFTFTKEEHAAITGSVAITVSYETNGVDLRNVTSRGDLDAGSRTWEIGDFPIRDTKRAIYVCEHCHRGWTDIQRIDAYKSGHKSNPPVTVKEIVKNQDGADAAVVWRELRAEWRATAPFNGVRSRHLSGMYLTIGLERDKVNYLHQFAENFLKAKAKGREALMVWTNIFESIPFQDAHEKADWRTIQERAEDYGPELPVQCVWIAWGGDVQRDRVELMFWGWGDAQEAWALERHVIYGDFDMPSCQERVWEYLESKRFKHPILGEMGWSAGAMDSGKQTKVQAVYAFCAKHRLSNVFSCKGFDQALGAVYQRATEKRFGGTRLNFNVDYLKTLVFDRLKNTEHGPRFIHFPKEEVEFTDEKGEKKTMKTTFDGPFFMQLCSERRIPVKNKKTGELKFQWVKLTSSTRNEVLDMTVYAFGVFEVCRQDEWIARKWKQVSAKLKAENKPDPVANRDYILNPPTEKKIPELVERTTDRKAVPTQPRRRTIRINSPFGNRFGR